MRLASFAAALALVAAPVRAAADGLEEARAHVAVLEYAEAEAALEAFLAAGSARAAEVREAYRLLGRVRAGLGDAAGAEEAFARLLALEPGASLPAGSSPKLTVPFDGARARAGAGIALRRELDPSRNAVALVIERDPLGLIAGARLRVEPGAAVTETRGAGRLVFALEPGARRATLSAIDRAGNELVVLPALEVPAASVAAVTPAASEPSLAGRWQLWAGVGAVFAAAGVSFGVVAASAEDDLRDLTRRARDERYTVEFEDAERAEARADRFSLLANASYALAAGSAIAAAILAWRGAGDDGDRGAALEAAVTAEGGAVTATWRF